MCLHCIGKVSNCSIKSCGRSWSDDKGTIHAYTKAIYGNNCLSSHSCHLSIFFFNQTPSCICSMCLYCIGKVSNCSIKSCGRSWLAHEGTIYAYTKALLAYNCLSSHSCNFVKYYFLWTKLLHAYVQCYLNHIGKVSNCSIKSCSRSWSAHEGTIYAYTKVLLGKNRLSSHSCHFVKKKKFWTKLLHAYVQCVYIVSTKYQIAPSKAVVEVDRPMKAPSMHIQTPYREKLSKFSLLSFCQKLFF